MYFVAINILINLYCIKTTVSCDLYFTKDLHGGNSYDSDDKTLKCQKNEFSSDEDKFTYNCEQRIRLETNKPIDYEKYQLFRIKDVNVLPFRFKKLLRNYEHNKNENFIVFENIKYKDFIFFYSFIMDFYVPVNLSASDFESIFHILVILEFEESHKFLKFLKNFLFFSILNLETLIEYDEYNLEASYLENSFSFILGKLLSKVFFRLVFQNNSLYQDLIYQIEKKDCTGEEFEFFQYKFYNGIVIQENIDKSFLQILGKDKNIFMQLKVLFNYNRIGKVKFVCINCLSSNLKKLLVLISKHLVTIEFFSSTVNLETLNFFNQENIFKSLKFIYFLNLLNKISECGFTGFRNNVEIFFSKKFCDYSSDNVEINHKTIFGISYSKFDQNFEKNIKLSENFEYSFYIDEGDINIDLHSFRNNEIVDLFHIITNNKVFIEKSKYILKECNEKTSFILIYYRMKFFPFYFEKLSDESPIQTIKIYHSDLEVFDLLHITRLKCLRNLHIENSIIYNRMNLTIVFLDNNIETLYLKNTLFWNLNHFLIFLNSFKVNIILNLVLRQRSSFILRNPTFKNELFNLFLLFPNLENNYFAVNIEKSTSIILIIHFKIFFDRFTTVFSDDLALQISTLNLYDCEILENSQLSLNKFKNLGKLELSVSRQEINFHQLFDSFWGQTLTNVELKNFKIEPDDIICIFSFKKLILLKFSNCIFAEDIQKYFKRKNNFYLKHLFLSFNPKFHYKELIQHLFEEFLDIFRLELINW